MSTAKSDLIHAYVASFASVYGEYLLLTCHRQLHFLAYEPDRTHAIVSLIYSHEDAIFTLQRNLFRVNIGQFRARRPYMFRALRSNGEKREIIVFFFFFCNNVSAMYEQKSEIKTAYVGKEKERKKRDSAQMHE